jgi:hypothetical protein
MNKKQMKKNGTKSTQTGEQWPERRCSRCNNFNRFDIPGADGGPYHPRVGDIWICANCGKITQIDSEMRLIEMSFAALQALVEEDPERIDGVIKVADSLRVRWIEQGCPSYQR